MSIGNIIKINQPDIYKKLIKLINQGERKYNKKHNNDNLAFEDFERMMRHDSYKRVKGNIRQVKHG